MKIKNNGYSFLFIIIYTLLFIVIINGFDLVNKWRYQAQHNYLRDTYYNHAIIYNWCDVCRESAEYDEDGNIVGGHCVCDRAVHTEKAREVIEKLYGRDVSIYKCSWAEVKGSLTEVNITFLFSYDSSYFFNIIKGRNLTKEDFESHSRVALISSDIEEQAIKKDDGYYIHVGGILYKIVGIYEKANSEFIEDIVAAYFPDTEDENTILCKLLGEEIWVGDEGIKIFLGSDDENDDILFEKANAIAEEINSIENVSSKAVRWTYENEETSTVSEEVKLLGMINGILLLFCLMCYMQTISVFTLKKQKDYTIYRVCGCSNLKISFEILKELIPLIICSIFISVIFNVFYNILITRKGFYSITAESICYMIIAVVTIVVISICCILRKITRINLVEGIMDL